MIIDKNQQQLGLAIIQDMPTDPDIGLLSGSRSWVVISFLTNKEERVFLENCETQNISIHKIIKVRDAVESYSPNTKTHYSEFVSNWPIDTLIQGISFKEKFTYRREISYCW